MSLDVYLISNENVVKSGTGIFVRHNGSNVELSPEEAKKRWPDQDFELRVYENNELYTDNITHNLNSMAEAAGIYKHLWRPDELGITKASELIYPLSKGLGRLMSAPSVYQEFNPESGWGDYDGLCRFVFNYIKACQQYPDAKVKVSR